MDSGSQYIAVLEGEAELLWGVEDPWVLDDRRHHIEDWEI